MRWILHLSTRMKLLLAFSCLLMLMLIVTVVGYRGLRTINASRQQMMTVSTESIIRLAELRANLNRQRALFLEFLLQDENAEREIAVKEIQERTREVAVQLADLRKRNAGNRHALTQLDNIESILDDYKQTRSEELDLIRKGKIDEAKALSNGVQDDRFEEIRSLALETAQNHRQHADALNEELRHQANDITRQFVIVGLFGILCSLVMVYGLNRIISDPLVRIAGIAEAIASGDLSKNVTGTDRRDEVGKLAHSFSLMVNYLQSMTHTAQRIAANDLACRISPASQQDDLGQAFMIMTQSLREMVTDVQEAANVLAMSVSEMAVSTTQLATSASETATSMSETTATIEEVRQIAQLSSQKAHAVSTAAQQATAYSEAGRNAVESSLDAMERIRQQMGAIADSIMQLSEQTQSIGEITASVNDLAEQSNLLAVNASIEAAKAGEHGRGFAVVAQEVRNLASQSKQATTRIRAILNDVQKATSSAVMATEQGSKAVEAGIQLVAHSGESIHMLSETIDASAEATAQIAQSSEEQVIGMDQVAVAMDSIKQASQQNLESARQVENAAMNLHELGQRMKQLINRYTV